MEKEICLKQNLICHLYQMTIKNKYLLVLDKCSKEYILKHFLNLHRKLKSVRKICIFYKLKPQAYLTNYLRF